MTADTTYRDQYVPKSIRRRDKIKGAECAKDGTMPGTLPAKMEDNTTYRCNYTPKPVVARTKAIGKDTTLTVLGQPFSGESETRHSFLPKSYQKRAAILPKRSDVRFGEKFEGDTTHKLDYPPKWTDPAKPIKQRAKWKPAEGKFFGDTTQSHDYKCPYPMDRTSPVVPKSEIQWMEGHFEGASHYKEDFPPHRVSTRKLPEWHPTFRIQKKSEAPLSKVTTYKKDFKVPRSTQREAYKPLKHNLTLPSGPMEKDTTTRVDYQPVEPVPTKSYKPDLTYTRPEGKIADCTTTRHDYTPKAIDRPGLLKTPNNLKLQKGKMEHCTTTRSDYQGACLECPAKFLKLYGKEALEDYDFVEEKACHEYYKVKNPGLPVVVEDDDE